MNNYDNYITGMYDNNSPMNQSELPLEPIRQFETLSDAYVNGDTEEFANFQEQILENAQVIRYAMKIVDSGLVGLLDKLITKLQ